MAGVSKEWFWTTENPYYDEFSIDRIEIFVIRDKWPDERRTYNFPKRQRWSFPGEKLLF
jgi:hypothetical protein